MLPMYGAFVWSILFKVNNNVQHPRNWKTLRVSLSFSKRMLESLRTNQSITSRQSRVIRAADFGFHLKYVATRLYVLLQSTRSIALDDERDRCEGGTLY